MDQEAEHATNDVDSPIELSQQEEQLVKRIRKAKLFVFLRKLRHELFDEAFPRELASLYRKAERGQPKVGSGDVGSGTHPGDIYGCFR